MAQSTTQNKYGSAVIYAVNFTVAWPVTNKFGSAGKFSDFFYSCLYMFDNAKSCMGDLLVWGSLRLTPIKVKKLIS